MAHGYRRKGVFDVVQPISMNIDTKALNGWR